MGDLNWHDVNDIAIELYDKFPDIDPQWIGFPDLHSKIFSLDRSGSPIKPSKSQILECKSGNPIH